MTVRTRRRAAGRNVSDPASTASIADRLRAAVGAVVDPELRRPIGELDMVADARVDEAGAAQVAITLTVVGCPAADRIEREVREAALAVHGVASVEVTLGVMTPAQRAALTERLRDGRTVRENPFGPDSLTRVIAVTSGKGGVGKSTVTANLAALAAARGLRVGVIDADVHGYSIPGLLGLTSPSGPVRPTRIDDLIVPPVGFGVKAISIGMFLETAAPVAWRGPMLHRTLNQFLTEVYFGDLDLLLLDLPPGTGDVAISAGQLLPAAEVIVVTTPQPAAADVAIRSGQLAAQTGQRVIGVVETMSGPAESPLFGSGGGLATADRLTEALGTPVPLLGSIPLSVALREGGDVGTPLVISDPDAPASLEFGSILDRILRSGRGLAGRALPVQPR